MDNPFKFMLASVLCIYFYKGLLKYLDFLGKEEDVYQSSILLQSLENVVNKKYERFVNTFKKYEKANPKKGTIFNDITQPDIQISELMNSLVGCFRLYFPSLNKNLNFRVVLFKVSDNKPTNSIYHFPYTQPVRTRMSDFISPNSTISSCIKNESLIIVSDVQKELKNSNSRYIRGKTPEDSLNSIICYPIRSTANNSIIYAISISVNKRNFFIQQNNELYESILKPYGTRLALEHCLKLLKERT